MPKVTESIIVESSALPGGGSTSGNQTSTNAILANIKTNTDNIPASPATAANQTTANSSLSSIDTKLTSQSTAARQDTMISSLQLIDDVPSGMNVAFSKGNPVMGQLDDVSTTAATEDNVAPARITAQRAIHVNLRNVAGTELGTSGAPVRVDPTGTTTQPVSVVAGSALIGKVGIDQTTPGTTNGVQINAALPAGTNVIGHVIVDTAPTSVLQAETTKVIGTVNISSAQSVGLSAGSAIVGKFGIDQTTPGTTNGVQVVAALPAGTNVIGHVIVDTAPTTVLQAETTKVIGTVNIASAQTVGLVAGSAIVGKFGIDQTTPGTTNGVQINAALPAGTNAIGKLSANSGVTIGAVEIAAAQTLATVTTVTTVTTVSTVSALTSITNALPAGTNRLGSVRPVDSADADLTAAKGSQTSRALGTQDLKDSGRTAVVLYATGVASGTTTTETVIAFTKAIGITVTTAQNDYTVTSGKKLRITSIVAASRGNVTATAQVTTFTFRTNAGAITTGSAALMSMRTATPATALAWDRVNMEIPDGYEITGDGTLRIGMTANAVFTTNAPTWDFILCGFEY